MIFHRNTFAHLENLKELRLARCKINEFNTDELPSLLEVLDLFYNELTTFTLTKTLNRLKKLNLARNHFTTFFLDLNKLPNIKEVDLSQNVLKNLNIIDNPRHSLGKLDLNGNNIENAEAYKWICANRYRRTDILVYNNYNYNYNRRTAKTKQHIYRVL